MRWLALLSIACAALSAPALARIERADEPEAAFFLGCLKDETRACYAGYGSSTETSIPHADLVVFGGLGEAESLGDAPEIEFAFASLLLRARWGGHEARGKPRWSVAAGFHGIVAGREVEELGGLHLARTNYGPSIEVGQDWPHIPLKPGWRFHQEWQKRAPRVGIRGLCFRASFLELCLDQEKVGGERNYPIGIRAYLPVGLLGKR